MSDKVPSQNNAMRYAGLATQWMVIMGLAAYGGNKIDHWVGWKFPVFLIVLTLSALAFSFWQLMNELNSNKK